MVGRSSREALPRSKHADPWGRDVGGRSIARGGEVESAERKLQELHERGLCALAYCAQAAMVVVSRDRERVEDLYRRALAMGYLPRDRVRVRPKVFQA